jgi:hypothetical protein
MLGEKNVGILYSETIKWRKMVIKWREKERVIVTPH